LSGCFTIFARSPCGSWMLVCKLHASA
jgi:hypothetical protein